MGPYVPRIGRWPVEIVDTVTNESSHEYTEDWECKMRMLFSRLDLCKLLRAERGHHNS